MLLSWGGNPVISTNHFHQAHPYFHYTSGRTHLVYFLYICNKMRFTPLGLVFVLLYCSLLTVAQNKPGSEFHIKRLKGTISLDGNLSEESWAASSVADGFFMNAPVDTMAPVNPTEVRMTFDNQNLYIGFTCYESNSATIIQSLRRDFEFRNNDNLGIYFDTYNDHTNGFFFNVNPFGVQREGLMSSGGNDPQDYATFWDNKWYTAAAQYEDRWVVEIAIPFKSIRYNADNWNFNVVRNDAKRNQVSSWIAAPLQYIPGSFAYSGKLIWDDPPPKPGLNISVIPYLAGSTVKDNEKGTAAEYDLDAGFDAKVAITPSLNLDVTVNPDFSQVEVDQQVINLTQFEFGFPERRQFFLENSDLFEQPGFPDTRPFFSRRIGLVRDSTDELQRVAIAYGARLSGKIGRNWRIGAMNLQTKKEGALGLPTQNYTVAVIQRNISRSNIGLVMVNKQSLGLDGFDSTKFYHESIVREELVNGTAKKTLNKYNRLLGADFNLRSINNKWRGDFYYHRSFDELDKDKDYSFGTFLGYFARNISILVGQNGAGENYNAEVGFVPKLDIFEGFHSGFVRLEGRLFPKSNMVANMGPLGEVNFNNLADGKNRDKGLTLGYFFNFFNTSRIDVGYVHTFQRLNQDFNPIDDDVNDLLLTGSKFSWDRATFSYTSDQRDKFTYLLNGSLGSFYNGTNTAVNGQVSYRFQPYGSFSVRFDFNDIRLPEKFGKEKLVLIGPRLDLTFTQKVFLTTFVQYNNLTDNVNLNTRLQWRFKPASDFFVVYTENYVSDSFKSKNRALVLKLTYWLNI